MDLKRLVFFLARVLDKTQVCASVTETAPEWRLATVDADRLAVRVPPTYEGGAPEKMEAGDSGVGALPTAEPRFPLEAHRPPAPQPSCCGRRCGRSGARRAGQRGGGKPNSLDEPMVAPSRDSNGVLQTGAAAAAPDHTAGTPSDAVIAKTHTENPMVAAQAAGPTLGARKPGATMGSGGNGAAQSASAAQKSSGKGATAQRPARMVAHQPAISSYQNGRRQRGRRVERWSNGKLMKHTQDGRAERVSRAIEQMNWLLEMEEPQPQRCRTVLIRYSHFASAPDVSATWLALQAKLQEVEAREEHASRHAVRQEHAEQIVLDTWSNIFSQVEPFTGREISPPPNLLPTMSPAASPLLAPAAGPRLGVAVTPANPGGVSTPLDFTLVEDDPGADLQLVPGSGRSDQSRGEGEFTDGEGQHHLESLRKGRRRRANTRSADDHNRGSGRHNRQQGPVSPRLRPTDGMPSPLLATPEGGMTHIPPLELYTHPMHIGPGLRKSSGSMRKSASFESSSTFGVALDSPGADPSLSPVLTAAAAAANAAAGGSLTHHMYAGGVLPTVLSLGSATSSIDGGDRSPTDVDRSAHLGSCSSVEGPPAPESPSAAGAGPPTFVHIATKNGVGFWQQGAAGGGGYSPGSGSGGSDDV